LKGENSVGSPLQFLKDYEFTRGCTSKDLKRANYKAAKAENKKETKLLYNRTTLETEAIP
jgi:hypothetical protein